MKLTRKCCQCKQSFNKSEMIEYASPGAKTMQWYCPECLEKKHSRENFANTICKIFGTKAPGARIWKERLRLEEKYGYTDSTIIECLNYLYNVEHNNKSIVSLYLVTPTNVEKAIQWKRERKEQANSLIAAMEEEHREIVFPLKQNKKSNKEILNADDFLF